MKINLKKLWIFKILSIMESLIKNLNLLFHRKDTKSHYYKDFTWGEDEGRGNNENYLDTVNDLTPTLTIDWVKISFNGTRHDRDEGDGHGVRKVHLQWKFWIQISPEYHRTNLIQDEFSTICSFWVEYRKR